MHCVGFTIEYYAKCKKWIIKQNANSCTFVTFFCKHAKNTYSDNSSVHNQKEYYNRHKNCISQNADPEIIRVLADE